MMASNESMAPDERFAFDQLPRAAERRDDEREEVAGASLPAVEELVLVRRACFCEVTEDLKLPRQFAAHFPTPERVLDRLGIEPPLDDLRDQRRRRIAGEEQAMRIHVALDNRRIHGLSKQRGVQKPRFGSEIDHFYCAGAPPGACHVSWCSRGPTPLAPLALATAAGASPSARRADAWRLAAQSPLGRQDSIAT